MNEKEILLGKNIALGGRNQTNTIPLEISATSKPLVGKDIKETVDLYNVYREEYGKCHKYRITLTLNPFCSNVLYNTCTEIVKNEGSNSCEVVTDSVGVWLSQDAVYGKYQNIKRAYMVSNTEYSSPENEMGYTYLPGYDIFDNHMLRNLSFRPVIPIDRAKITDSDRGVFNTTADWLRTNNGDKIKLYPRFSLSDVQSNTNMSMHMYEHSNLLDFIDGSSERANLQSENGWYGFKNISSITSEDKSQNVSDYAMLFEDKHIFSHTINNVENCDFVQMFPDSTRYSLVPHYNKDRNRYEKNWDVFLTYPWKNFYNHNLIRNVRVYGTEALADGKTNALLCFRVLRTRLSNNRKTMLFRTFCKHGLFVNDKIVVYLSKDNGNTYDKLPKQYTVDYVGDINGNNKEYFFGISSKVLVNDIFEGMIESLFYPITPITIPVNPVTSSTKIWDVPDEYDSEPIQVFKYIQTYTPSTIPYTVDNTFDALPKTINVNSPQMIRVWNGEYDYMDWDITNETYVLRQTPNLQATYDVNNTFTDVPDSHLMNAIRVKKYDYFVRSDNNYYQMDSNLDIDGVINNMFVNGGFCVRFVKIVNNVECEYYIRQFRKIPNFKYSSEPLPSDIASDSDAFLRFLNENASENGTMTSFDSETYRLAFSKTIYGDDVAQVTFMDDIDVQNLVDNLGRPVTEIYATVVKRNKGYDTWYSHKLYETPDYGSEDIEYSRCFGSLITGLEYLDLDDDFDVNENTWRYKRYMSSVTSIYRGDDNEGGRSLENWDEEEEQKEITELNDVYFGDVVEFDRVKCKETVLSEACFRFNTAQRELGIEESNGDFNFTYHTLQYDDYDPADPSEGRKEPFRVVEYRQWNEDETYIPSTIVVRKGEPVTIRRPEGYFYKPHTKIPLLRYTDKVFQASHRTLQIKSCEPIQAEGIYVKVTTMVKHGLVSGTTMYVVNGDEWIETTIAYVIDGFSFTLNPITKNDCKRNGNTYIDWVSLCSGISNGSLILRVRNIEIPTYATRIDENVFVWREVVNPGDLPENDNYKFPLSNEHFYVDSQVNIFLRRQDPYGLNGLYYYGNANGSVSDVEGEIIVNGNNEYKTEEEFTC